MKVIGTENRLFKIFKQYPKPTFNLFYFGLVLIVLVTFYWQFSTSDSDEKYIQKEINKLPDEKRLDTLIRLIHGDEIQIRNFPFLKTYSVTLKVNNNNKALRYRTFGHFVSTNSFSFLQVSEDKYLIKNNKSQWTIDSLNHGYKFRDQFRYTSDYNYYDYNDLNLTIPLIKTGLIKSASLNYLSLNSDLSHKQDSVSIPDTFKNHPLNQMTISNPEDKIYLSELNRRNSVAAFSNSDLYKRYQYKIYSVDVDDNSAILTNIFSTDTSTSDYSLNANATSLYILQKQAQAIHKQHSDKNLDLIKIDLDDLSKTTLMNSIKKAPFDPFISDNSNEYFVSGLANGSKIAIYNITDGKKIDSTKNTYTYALKKNANEIAEFDCNIFNKIMWMKIKYKNFDNSDIVRVPLSNETIGKPSEKNIFIPAGSLTHFGKEGITYYFSNEGNISFVTTDGKNIYKPNKEDDNFLKKIRDAVLYIPKYGNENSYVANFNDGLAIIDIGKSNNEYDYKFINNINWSNGVLSVKPVIDTFFIIILIAFAVSAYFVLYFLFRGYFDSDKVLIKYTDKIFQSMPLLNTKIQILQSDMNQLKLRSDYMLALGITLGAGGVLASIITFQATESTIGNSWGSPHTFLGIFRPVVLLAFIEMFTFYFLKQYRIIFNEYKRFYSLFLNLSSYFSIVELNANKDIAHDARDTLLKKFTNENIALHENNTMKQIDEFDHDSILKLIEAMDKFKKPS